MATQKTLRTFDADYLKETDAYWAKLLPELKDELYVSNKGGSVLMLQIENEFGSFGDAHNNENDKKYMEHLKTLARQYFGDDAALFTTDGNALANSGGK
jgi:hypothetical protein